MKYGVMDDKGECPRKDAGHGQAGIEKIRLSSRQTEDSDTNSP